MESIVPTIVEADPILLERLLEAAKASIKTLELEVIDRNELDVSLTPFWRALGSLQNLEYVEFFSYAEEENLMDFYGIVSVIQSASGLKGLDIRDYVEEGRGQWNIDL